MAALGRHSRFMDSSPRNLAARAGRWSAQHRKKAIFGWLAFVIIAVVHRRLGRDEDARRRRLRRRRVRPRRQGRRRSTSPTRAPRASWSRAETAPAPTTRSSARSSASVVGRLERTKNVQNVKTPYGRGQRRPALRGRALRARDLRAAGRQPRGQGRPVARRGRRARQAARAASASSSSATAARTRRSRKAFEDDFQQGRVHLAADHARDPDPCIRRSARGLRAPAARHHRRRRRRSA